MEDVELEYDEDDFSNLTNFKLFCDNIKPLVVADTSAKLSAGKLNKFLQAKYREFVMQVPPMERSNYDTAGVGKSSGIFIETGALLKKWICFEIFSLLTVFEFSSSLFFCGYLLNPMI